MEDAAGIAYRVAEMALTLAVLAAAWRLHRRRRNWPTAGLFGSLCGLLVWSMTVDPLVDFVAFGTRYRELAAQLEPAVGVYMTLVPGILWVLTVAFWLFLVRDIGKPASTPQLLALVAVPVIASMLWHASMAIGMPLWRMSHLDVGLSLGFSLVTAAIACAAFWLGAARWRARHSRAAALTYGVALPSVFILSNKLALPGFLLPLLAMAMVAVMFGAWGRAGLNKAAARPAGAS
jgi:hypothetical protein